MNHKTGGKTARKSQLHLGRNGWSYAFRFDEGSYEPRCDLCKKYYESLGVQVSFRCGPEVCPECLLAGPQAVTRKARKSRSNWRREAAEVLGRLDSFTQLPGGILAVKIAEAYREAGKEA